MLYIYSPVCVLMTNPKELLFGSVIACSFVVGATDHPTRTFTTAEWVNSVVQIRTHGKIAKWCIENLKKGDLVYIQGKFRQSEWKPREGPDIRLPISECILDRIHLHAHGNAAEIITPSPMIERILRDWGYFEGADPTAD